MKNFSGGTIGGLRLDFADFQGVGGGLCLAAQGFPALLLLPFWLLSVRLLAFIGYIVSIGTDNKYYVTSPLFCLLAYVYMSELLTPLKWLANRLKFNFQAG